MGRFFSKIYHYTPMGWLTSGYKKLGWSGPDDYMTDFVNKRSDASIIAQIIAGVVGGSALGNISASSSAGSAGAEAAATGGASLLSKIKKMSFSDILTLATAGSGIASTAGLTGNQVAQNDYNSAQADKAREWQEQMYNKYYSPQAQVQQYKEAGLNPMSLAGGNSITAQTPGASAPQSAGPNNDIVGALSSLLELDLKSKRNEADIALTRSQTVAQDIENKYQEGIKQLELEERRQNIENSRVVNRILTSDANMKEVMEVYYPEILGTDLAAKKSSIALTEQQTKKVEQEITQAEQKFPKEMRQIDALTSQIQAQTAYLQAQTSLIAEQKKLVAEQVQNAVKERDKIIADTNLSKKEYDCYEAIHSQVQVVPDLSGNKDRVIVKKPNGTIVSYDITGFEKTFKRDLEGNKVK